MLNPTPMGLVSPEAPRVGAGVANIHFAFIDEIERRVVVRAFRLRIAAHAVLFSTSILVTAGFVPVVAELAGAADHVATFGMARLLGLGVLAYLGMILVGWAVTTIFRDVPR